MVTGDSQEKVMIFRDKQTLHHNIYIINIIIIIFRSGILVHIWWLSRLRPPGLPVATLLDPTSGDDLLVDHPDFFVFCDFSFSSFSWKLSPRTPALRAVVKRVVASSVSVRSAHPPYPRWSFSHLSRFNREAPFKIVLCCLCM